MSFGVAFDLSRFILGRACQAIPMVRLTDLWSRHESDDDFEGTRNWAVLLVLLSVPVFLICLVSLLIWIF